MRIAIAGGHGQIALTLTARLTAGGAEVVSVIRNPDHADDVRARGGQPVLCDLERATVDEIAGVIAGADVVVFAAGAGAGSGAERKLTLDRDGAIKLLDAARARDVPRYVMISSVGAENPPAGDDVFSVYLRAKSQADAELQASDRDWTIVRPGRLTDGPATGRVRLSADPFRGQVAREDVAAVIDALLHEPHTVGLTLYVNGGEDTIEQALAGSLGQRGGSDR
jgi:nucleoside-diphosphate-sugar epimerase